MFLRYVFGSQFFYRNFESHVAFNLNNLQKKRSLIARCRFKDENTTTLIIEEIKSNGRRRLCERWRPFYDQLAQLLRSLYNFRYANARVPEHRRLKIGVKNKLRLRKRF